MAFVEKTAFEARLTNNENDVLANVAGLYKEDGVAADCSAGLLCARGFRVPAEGFSGIYNENTREMVASAAGEEAVIYACDTHEAQLLTAPNGNAYFIGTETLGLGVPAGRIGNFCRINFDGQSIYRFGEGNISGTVLTSTKYFSIYNGLLKVEASKPDGKYFTLEATGNFTTGNIAGFKYYDVIGYEASAVDASH